MSAAMGVRRLGVSGALLFTPRVFADERGAFVSTYQESDFLAAAGRPLFPVAQVSHSTSKRGVLRGVHYTATPPGMAKYVHCPRGRVLDVVVDLRLGSPTFGRWDSVELDSAGARALYLPIGLGHLFVALEDDSVMHYTMSREYSPENERAIAPFDPRLDLDLPAGTDPVMSRRDREAPSLAEAAAAGLLPDYDHCRALERGPHPGPAAAAEAE